MIWHHIYKAHHGVAQSSILFSKSEFAARVFVSIGGWLCRKFSTARWIMISLQIWQRMRIVHNFKFTGFVFFICMQEFCCLGPCFFKIIFAPFVEIDVWYKFVHNLLISERISNITRHKCSKFSALQYHKSDSRYQSNDLTPYIQSGPRRRAVQHFVFKVGIRST